MQIIKTQHHLIYTAEKEKPEFACLGSCKKVWWKGDIEDYTSALAKPACPQCKGEITTRIPEGHYSVITQKAGEVTIGKAVVTNAGIDLRGR